MVQANMPAKRAEEDGLDFIIELVGLVSGKLEEAARTDVVVGQPIALGAVTIVPLSRLSVGLGVAGGAGEGEASPRGFGKNKFSGGRGKGNGGMSGMGAKVRPVGVAIFTEDGVEVLPIGNKLGIIDKIFDKIPKLIEMVEDATGRSRKKPGKKQKAVEKAPKTEEDAG